MSDNGSPRDGLSPAKQALLELRLQQRAAARSAGPVRRPGDGPFPLSPGQQRMWLIDQLHPGLAAYNVGRVLRIRGELDVAALERAVDGIVARHTALRTALVLEDGGPVQYVRAATPVGIEVVDLTGHADPEAAALALAREEWRRPFALESGRLLRARLIALAPEHHLLVLMIHHAASDEGSKVLLFDELAHRYAAAAAGRDAGLAEPELRYVDVAAWEREQLDAAALAGHLDWWREYLAGAPVELELPHDAPRPAVPTYAGARHHAVLDAEVVARLRALAREQGATLFAVVLAGYATLLSRYSGQDDLVVMAPVAGRGHAAEDVVGLFMNNVVLRVDVGGRPTFRELVARVRESAIGAFRHQDVPFDVLVQELADSRDLGRPPLAETMFNFFEASEAAPRLGDLDVSAVEVDPGTTKIDLALVATVRDGELRLLWEYSSELFSAHTVARMTEHLRALLDAAGRAPDTAVGTLPMLSAAERDALTGELARTAAPIPGGGVQDHVAARARERPDALAVQCGDRTLTYRELDRRANGIARALVDAGVPAGAFVGIALPRSADLPAAVLGVLKAGCAYLPLDPALPQARLEYMLEDSGAAAVLVPAPGTRGAGLTEIVVDDDLGAADDPPSAARAAAPGDAAYIIYTSGSTGRPKGVVLEQRNLLNLLASMCREPGIGADDVLLAVTTLSFDISGLELLGPLLAGGRVVISRDGEAADPDALQALLASSGATVLQATPSTWRMLLDAGWPGDPNLRALCGGEALPPALAAELVGRVGSLWNVYGPTETTIWSTCAQITDPAAEITIGTAIANTACYVLDDRDDPVPAGVVGELCIGGAGVARGYHGRPELDAERFVGDPFVPGGRMYRTGDRVRRRADGRLVFLGRGDHQVKLRGHRIELGEIEAVLVRHPAVREAAVALRDDGGTEPRLVAYVTGDADPDALLAFAAESLPAPMLPALVVELAQMPQTANGKLDRKALPRPPAPVAAGAIAPVGELETTIAGVWAAVLGVPTVGRHDDFFRLGGHSLSATRLAARINAEVGARLPMRAIFEAPTVARLARVVEESTAMASTADVPPPPLVREPRDARRVPRAALGHPAVLAALTSDGPTLAAALATATGGGPAAPDAALAFPASFQQRRVWFLDRLETGSALYAVPLVLGIDGPLDADALQHALDGLVARHEILRTTLVEHDGVPVQVVSAPAPFALRSLEAADEAAALALVREETERPFDLAAGPLARAVLVRVSAERHVVGLVFHHAVADGWSLQLLVDELGALVRGHAPATAVDLQYGDYALWQQRWLRGGVLDAELGWWRTTLSGAPAELELPADRPRPAVSDHAGARHVVLLPGGLLEGLERVASDAGATLFMTLTAAVQTLLSRYTGETDVVVGAPVSGRARAEFEGLVGYLANTLVLRTRLDGDPAFTEALARVKTTTLGALAHQDVPFDRLVEELAPDRDLSRNPLFGVLVMLQDDRVPAPDLPGARVELLDVDRGVARFDLSLSFARRDGGLRVAWEYSSELFDAGTVQRFAGHLRTLLEAVVAAPETPLSRLALIPAPEQRLLAELNATDRPIDERPVHERVAAQAAERPDAVAVTSGGRSITYRELDERANRLAHALVEQGAGPGVLVGLRVDRSVDLIVGIHGVLRSGAAYIPLDPDYPTDRVEFMLADAAAPLLVTRSDLRDGMDPGAAHVICLDDPALEERSADALEPRAGLDDLVYVIYTSGSTGRPKGVMLEHRCLVNLMDSMSEHPGIAPGETMLGLTTPAFDLSVPDLYLPLVNGARLAIATADEAADPRVLGELLARTEATVVQATPATWRMLLDDGWAPQRPMRIVVGGEAVPAGLAEQLRDVMAEAWNFYGPTETCVWSTCWRISGELGSEVPIGRPIGNTAVYILDAAGEQVPAGVLGELHIGGWGVARGYLGREELSAEKFVADPFRPGGRMYRTGDLARVRPDGLLAFSGRRDHQIKLRGFRIELGEIETSLEHHERVRQAVVIVREDQPGDQRLVAYVVADGTVDTPELLDHLAVTLPVYMLPNAVVALDALPLTPNGKLDRKALPVPEVGAGRAPAAPRTPIEEQLVVLWADVLGRDDVGVEDNLFHLGAHSLLVTRVIARIRETIGVEIPLRRVYEAPTIAALAGEVVSAMLLNEPDDLEALLSELEETPDA